MLCECSHNKSDHADNELDCSKCSCKKFLSAALIRSIKEYNQEQAPPGLFEVLFKWLNSPILSRFEKFISKYDIRIQDELRKNIAEIISETGQFVIADRESKQIKDASVVTKTKLDEKSGITYETDNLVYSNIILDAYPQSIEIIHDPLEQSKKYIIHLELAKGSTLTIGPHSLQDLCSELLKTSLVYKSRVLQERIAAIINAYTSNNKVIYKEEIEKEGFFWINDKLVASKVELKAVTKEQAREAIKFIKDVQAQFYSTKKDTARLAHMIKIAMISPFAFARKQNRAIIDHGWIPATDLNGRSQVGKSKGLGGHILLGLWNRNNQKYYYSYHSIATPARLSNVVNKTTFPIRIDEADALTNWSSDARTEEILSLLKNIVESEEPRTTLTQDRKEVKTFALSIPILTHNSSIADEEGYLSRYTNIHFTQDDDKNDSEKHVFEEYMKKNITKYHYLGYFTANYVLKNPNCLFDRWNNIATKILREFYAFAEKEYPTWLDETIENSGLQDATSDRIESIRSIFVNLIIETFNKYSRDPAITLHIETDIVHTIEQKLNALIDTNLIPYFARNTHNDLCITHSIIDVLKRHNIDRMTLTDLAEMLGFEYKLVKLQGKPKKVAVGDFSKFTDFLKADMIALVTKVQSEIS